MKLRPERESRLFPQQNKKISAETRKQSFQIANKNHLLNIIWYSVKMKIQIKTDVHTFFRIYSLLISNLLNSYNIDGTSHVEFNLPKNAEV